MAGQLDENEVNSNLVTVGIPVFFCKTDGIAPHENMLILTQIGRGNTKNSFFAKLREIELVIRWGRTLTSVDR